MKNDFQILLLAMLVLLSGSAAGQTLGEAFGVNSDHAKLPAAQNDYPTIREFHLWTDDQNYPTERTQVGYPLNDFDFSQTDAYYSQRRGSLINTAFGIPGEMRGLIEDDFSSAAGLKWFVQKPFTPFGYREQGSGLIGADSFFLDNNGTSQYYGDWIDNPGFPQDEPKTWRDKARWMSLLAERYGDASLLDPTIMQPDPNDPTGKAHWNDVQRLYDDQVIGNGSTRSPVVFFEAENEPDREFFEPSESQVSPTVEPNTPRTMWQTSAQSLAAQTSMLYDGHGKSPASIFPPLSAAPLREGGPFHLGVKNVGPNNKVSITGLAGLRGAYIEEMLDWFITNRQDGILGFDGSIGAPVMPFEAISVHHYPASTSNPDFEVEYTETTIGQWNTSAGVGQSPEEHELRPRLNFFLNKLGADFNAEGYLSKWEETEVWLSEFGYDSNNREPGICFDCPDCGTDPDCPSGQVKASSGIQIPFINDVNTGVSINRELLQAQWLSRSYLEIMVSRGDLVGHRIDRFMQFELVDTEDTDSGGPAGGVFATSGLYRLNGIPKPSHFFTQTMLTQLKDFDHDFSAFSGEYIKFPLSVNDALDYTTAVAAPGEKLPFSATSFDLDVTETLPVAYRYRRTFGDPDDLRLVVWSPTGGTLDDPDDPGTNIIAGGYQYDIDLDVAKAFNLLFAANGTKVTMIELVDGSTIGRPTELTVNSDGTVTISVSESPIILQLGSLGSITQVSTVASVNFEDFCCGNIEASWARARRTLRDRVDVYYIAADDVVGSFVPFRDLITIAEDFSGTSLTLPQLIPGTDYFLVILPTNRFGFGVDISGGVDFDPLAQLAHPFTPEECTDGGEECVTDILASSINVTAGFTSSADLATVFSGGQDVGNGDLSCNIDNPSALQPQWGANEQGTFSAEITFNPPIDIERIQLFFGGADAVLANFQIDVKTCECNFWTSYGTVTPGVNESFQLTRNQTRVTQMRLTNTQANLAAMILCSEETSCLSRRFTEEPSVEVSAVDKTRATVAWTPSFNTTGQEEATGYVIEFSQELTDEDFLSNPEVINVAADVGGSLSQTILDLEPGQEYFGRLLPTTRCLEAFEVADGVLIGRPFSPSDTTYFTFTTKEDPEGSNGRQASTGGPNSEIHALEGLGEVSKVFPNPSVGLLNVVGSERIISISVRDIQGRILGHFTDFDSSKVELDISKFTAGMLMVIVNTETGSDTHLVKLE